MTRISASVVALAFFLGALPAMAADENTRTCSLTKVIECSNDEGCAERSIQDMALPRFVRIDFNAKTITSLDKEVTRTSKIASIENQEGVTIMHGTELRGWTTAIGEKSGDLTLTASGDGEGFVVFGTCMCP